MLWRLWLLVWSDQASKGQWVLLSCCGQLLIMKGTNIKPHLISEITKTCSANCDLSTKFNNSQRQNEDSLPAAFFYTKRTGFLYQNEISSVAYGFRGGWSWPALPCGLAKPVISTSQGCISDVFAVPKCPQRNMWWMYGHLRAQIEILPSYLHRPGTEQ